MEKFARICDLTGTPMNSGYLFGGGMFYIMDDMELLKKHIEDTRGEYADMSDEDNDVMTMPIDDLIEFLVESDVFYYTEWDAEEEDYYYDSEGNEYSND